MCSAIMSLQDKEMIVGKVLFLPSVSYPPGGLCLNDVFGSCLDLYWQYHRALVSTMILTIASPGTADVSVHSKINVEESTEYAQARPDTYVGNDLPMV